MLRTSSTTSFFFALVFALLSLFMGKGETMAGDDIDKGYEAFMNREIYEKLDVEILRGIADDDIEQAIVDYVMEKFDDDWGNEQEVVMSLPPAIRALYTTWTLEAEVENGGFNQFFWNSSGQFAEVALQGFRLFGAEGHAKVTEQAIQVYKSEKTMHEGQRAKGTMDALSESYENTNLGELDEQFYSLEDDLSALRVAYIRARPEVFVGD